MLREFWKTGKGSMVQMEGEMGYHMGECSEAHYGSAGRWKGVQIKTRKVDG